MQASSMTEGPFLWLSTHLSWTESLSVITLVAGLRLCSLSIQSCQFVRQYVSFKPMTNEVPLILLQDHTLAAYPESGTFANSSRYLTTAKMLGTTVTILTKESLSMRSIQGRVGSIPELGCAI